MATFTQWMSETAGEVTGNILRQFELLTHLDKKDLESKFFQTRAGKDLEDKKQRDGTAFTREFYRFVVCYAFGQQEFGQVVTKALSYPKLTFEVMAAWPDVGKSVEDTQEHLVRSIHMEGWSTFAPIMGLADDITSLHLFNAVAGEDSHEISWPRFKQYIDNLKKISDGMKQRSSALFDISKQFSSDKEVIDVDGAPTSPVILLSEQTKRPIRIMLTENAIYFKSKYVAKDFFGKALYERIDLKKDESTQVLAPENAIFSSQMFDSELKITTAAGRCYRFFFPSISGGQRRDMWMVGVQEAISFHKVCKKLKIQDASKEYSSLRTLLVGGCVRLRAVIPLMTQTDYSTLMPHSTILNNPPVGQILYQFVSGAESRASVQSFVRSQFKAPEEKTPPMIDAASLDDVKGNVSLFEALMQPTVDLFYQANALLQWQDPFLSLCVLLLLLFIAYQNWVHYLPSIALMVFAARILRLRTEKLNKDLGPILFTDSKRSAVAKIRRVKDLFEKFKYVLRRVNHALLKLHALARSQDNEATDQFLAVLIAFALALGLVVAYIPIRYLFLLVVLISFLRDCPFVEPAARLSSHYLTSVDRSNKSSVLGRLGGSLPLWMTSRLDSLKKKGNGQDGGQYSSAVSLESTHEENADSDICDPDLSHGGTTTTTTTTTTPPPLPPPSRSSSRSATLSPDESSSLQSSEAQYLSSDGTSPPAQSDAAAVTRAATDYNEELHGDSNYTAAGRAGSFGHAQHNTQHSLTFSETVKWRVISWWLSIPAAPVQERSKVD